VGIDKAILLDLELLSCDLYDCVHDCCIKLEMRGKSSVFTKKAQVINPFFCRDATAPAATVARPGLCVSVRISNAIRR
jgi:hypothetical protein